MDERAALLGLAFVEAIPATGKTPVHRYSFPAQETDLRGDEDLHNVGGSILADRSWGERHYFAEVPAFHSHHARFRVKHGR